MDINSFVETPIKRKSSIKIIKKLHSVSILIMTFCIIICCLFAFKMISKIYENNKLKSEYNAIIEHTSFLSQKSSELTQLYSNKQTEFTNVEKLYNDNLASSPIAYLTFDDGPSDNTLKLLDILDKYNVKATFFVNYKPGYDNVYKEIVKRGHVLANHTYDHNYKEIYSSPDAFIDNILKLDKKLEEITGVAPSKILRFPGGSNTDFITKANADKIQAKLSELGYVYFDWNVDSTDASALTQPKNSVLSGVLNGVEYVNTANILMHDTNMKYTTLEAMPEIIEGLKAKGYRFKPLSHNSVKIQF